MTGAAAFTWRDFQIWFDGFSENVEKAPTEKQWARVRDQIARVDSGSAPPPVAATAPASPTTAPAAPAPPADEKPRRPTMKAWRQLFVDTLLGEEFGYDPDTAREMIPAKVDTGMDPVTAARMAHSLGGVPG